MNSKIITCAPIPPPSGGIANWYNILVYEGERNGYTFVNMDTSPRKSIDSRSLFYRIVVQGFRMLGQGLELKRLINRNEDVCVAHIATSGQLSIIRDIIFLQIFKSKNIKTVYHLHYGRIPEIVEKKGLEYYFLRKAMALADALIAIDPNTLQVINRYFEIERIQYIPNPVRACFLNTSQEKKNALFLGNVLESKGIEELLQAWDDVVEHHPDWSLTIAGYVEPKYRSFLVHNYPMHNVKLTGYLEHDDAIQILTESAFLILPSYTEGFPNVIIEAMMCEKAVIATSVGAIPDILADNIGVIIPPKDVGAIRDSMNKLIKDNLARKEMGRKGRQKAMCQYASDVVFQKYATLWSSLLEEPRRS